MEHRSQHCGSFILCGSVDQRISANAFNLAYKNTKKRKDMGEVDAPGAGALTLEPGCRNKKETER